MRFVLFIILLVLAVLIIDKKMNQAILTVSFRQLDLVDEEEMIEDALTIHVANQDNLIIPVHIQLNRAHDYRLKGYEDQVLNEEGWSIYYTFSLLTNLSNHLPLGVKTLIPRSTKLLDYELNGPYLTLYVSRDFYGYNKAHEERMLNIISHTYKENLDVDYVKIVCDGREIRYEGYDHVWLNNRDFELNPIHQSDDRSYPTTVFYYVAIEDEMFLTPITIYSAEPNTTKEHIQTYLKFNLSLPVITYTDDSDLAIKQYQYSLFENELMEESELEFSDINQYTIYLY